MAETRACPVWRSSSEHLNILGVRLGHPELLRSSVVLLKLGLQVSLEVVPGNVHLAQAGVVVLLESCLELLHDKGGVGRVEGEVLAGSQGRNDISVTSPHCLSLRMLMLHEDVSNAGLFDDSVQTTENC